MSLKETICHAAGHGTEFNFAWDPRNETDNQRNMEGLNGTVAVKDLLNDVREAMSKSDIAENIKKETCIGWVYFWSDAFLRCFIKQKENSVWILTATVCPPEAQKSNGLCTYVLAMGKSSEDHTPVIEHYLAECKELMKGFDCYFGNTNRMGRMAVGMLSWNADRPERKMILNTKREGHWGKISGWSACLDEEVFPACEKCYPARVKRMLDQTFANQTRNCQLCCDWKLREDRGGTPALKDYPPKSNYGDENLSQALQGRKPGSTTMFPKKLTTEFMVEALKLTLKKRVRGDWGKGQAKTYLTSFNVTGRRFEFVEYIVARVKNNECAEDHNAILPKVWTSIDCFSRFKFPELPMHGLGHGIITDVMAIIQHIFAKYKRFSKYVEFANTILVDIQSFHLSWCKVKKLPKAAWVNENEMAYMRLFSYLHGSFLAKFGLSAANDGDGMTMKNENNMRRLINALQALVSILMSEKKVSECEIDDHMKLFMSTAHSLNKDYGSLGCALKSTSSASSTAEATASIVNLPKQVCTAILEQFGVTPGSTVKEMRNQVKKIKVGELRKYFGDQFPKTTMKNVLLTRLIQQVSAEVESVANDHNGNGKTGQKKERIYVLEQR